MKQSTLRALLSAITIAPGLLPLLVPFLQCLGKLLQTYRCGSISPQATYQLEVELGTLLRAVGKVIVQWLLQAAESDAADHHPGRLCCNGVVYRRRQRSPRTVATLFGSIVLWRFLYEPLEKGESCLHPLEKRLGLVAGCATPALAERAGQWSAQQPQRAVQDILRRDHGVSWSAHMLRKVVRNLRDGMVAFREETQVEQVLHWLGQAFAGRGPHRPVLAVGRDGIHVPLRENQAQEYHEGSVATVSVIDRRGKRLGTVYLGQMPEAQQVTLSAQLTALVQAVLRKWEGDRPRLAYVTDAGWHPTDYFRRVLRGMEDPRQPGRRLPWDRILDFYHACTYVTKMAEALFEDEPTRQNWACRMRQRLKQSHGVTRLLQSASAHANQRKLPPARAKALWQAYRYLRKHRRQMDYSRYRRQGLPLGSGITEAACKTVFTQRLKQSGMGWKTVSGQVIVDLRVIWLSRIWTPVWKSYLNSQTSTYKGTLTASAPANGKNAA